jgi:Flp pilus assembly pilin Flp
MTRISLMGLLISAATIDSGISYKGEHNMLMFLSQLKSLISDEEGQTAVEYALMLVLVALGVAAATPGIDQAVIGVFTRMATALQ